MSLQEEIFKTYSLRLEQTSEELKRQGEFVRELFQSRYYPHVRGYTNPSVLEIGCNKGFMTRAVGAFFPTSDIVGIDMSPDDIRFAQNTCTPLRKGHSDSRVLIFSILLSLRRSMISLSARM